MENKRNVIRLAKTKRLDTVKRKARELSVLCNIDVCFIGTHDPDLGTGSDSCSTSSETGGWHTYPEDPKELERILSRYKDRLGEKEPEEGLGREGGLDFDVDKALEGLSLEELCSVLETVDERQAEVEKKLDSLLKKNSGDADTSPTLFGFPLHQTTGESISDEFMVVENAQSPDSLHEHESEVASEGPKIFGVFLKPAVDAQSSSESTQHITESEV